MPDEGERPQDQCCDICFAKGHLGKSCKRLHATDTEPALSWQSVHGAQRLTAEEDEISGNPQYELCGLLMRTTAMFIRACAARSSLPYWEIPRGGAGQRLSARPRTFDSGSRIMGDEERTTASFMQNYRRLVEEKMIATLQSILTTGC